MPRTGAGSRPDVAKRNRERYKDLSGRRFGDLQVLERAESVPGKGVQWRCRCLRKRNGKVCGVETVKLGTYLRNGDTTSCGCLQREHASEMGETEPGTARL